MRLRRTPPRDGPSGCPRTRRSGWPGGTDIAGGPFAVEWSRPATRSLARLPEKIAVAAVEFIFGPLASNPERVGRPLRFELEGHHSARLGTYRIIYRIDHERRRVIVEVIEHRGTAYRRR